MRKLHALIIDDSGLSRRTIEQALRFRSPAGRIWLSVTLGMSPGLIL